MAPRHLRFSLLVLQLATIATLVRSVALDRWITVAASIVLLGATYAARRGRTWGVALAFALGITFTALWALGVGPAWFAVFGMLALRPFVRLFRHFARFDRGAATMLATLATGIGAGGAIMWKEFAYPLFRAFPALVPSAHLHHGFAILAMLAGGALATFLPRARQAKEDATGRRVRIAPLDMAETEEAEALEELENEPPLPPARAHLSRP